MKIEESKYYRDNFGQKWGPMKIYPEGPREVNQTVFIIKDGDGMGWDQNGIGMWGARGINLIAEWHDDTTAQDDYATLRAILDDAYEQASSGKGKERHANDRPFLQQPICEIGRMLGSVCDGELYQAIKKAQEASNMLARHENKRAEAELLGAINYLAAAVILIRENINDA